MNYTTILWDIDGTILDFLAAEYAAINKCFEIFNLGQCTDEMIERYSKINRSYWERLERGEITKSEVLVGRFREFFEKEGLDASKAEKFNENYQIRLGDTVVFRDNAKAILEDLRQKGYKQFIVTNGTKVAQDRKLDLSGVGAIMDDIYISEEVGIEKPMIGFFEKIFSDYPEISKKEMIIIGDSLTSDMRGGMNAGIATCWYNPSGQENLTDVRPDFVISNLNEVYSII